MICAMPKDPVVHYTLFSISISTLKASSSLCTKTRPTNEVRQPGLWVPASHFLVCGLITVLLTRQIYYRSFLLDL